MSQILTNYELACESIALEFTLQYYADVDSEFYWIGDQVGGLLSVNDEFYDMQFMVEALRLKIGVKKMFEYYEYKMDPKVKSPNKMEYWMSGLEGTS